MQFSVLEVSAGGRIVSLHPAIPFTVPAADITGGSDSGVGAGLATELQDLVQNNCKMRVENHCEFQGGSCRASKQHRAPCICTDCSPGG
jgi:hypothetical protein